MVILSLHTTQQLLHFCRHDIIRGLHVIYSQLHESSWRSCCRWELEIQHKANLDHHVNRFCNGVHTVHQCRVYNGVHSCFSQAAGWGQQNYDMRLHSSTPNLGMNSGCFGTNVGIQVDTTPKKTVKWMLLYSNYYDYSYGEARNSKFQINGYSHNLNLLTFIIIKHQTHDA